MHQFLVNAHTFQRAIKNFVQCLVWNFLNSGFQSTLILMKDGIYLPENHLVLILS